MIQYRPFLNTDLPHIQAIWDQQSEMLGQIRDLIPFRLEQSILSKPYFDSLGLLLAVESEHQNEDDPNARRVAQGTPLGMVHATFVPNAALSDFDRSEGIISLLKVVDGERAEEVADNLLEKAVEYLRSRGAERIYAGSKFPFSPFYQGIYGGSEIPGVLTEDHTFSEALKRFGFQQADEIVVLQRRLAGFRPISGRDQLAVRRKYQINTVREPKDQSWFECCTLGTSTRERFSIYHKQNQRVCGNVSFWDMQPMAGGESVARGMYGLNVPEEFRRTGIATFLVGEALKYYMQQGIEFVEAQTYARELAAVGVFEKLGFEQVNSGNQFVWSL